MKTLRMDERVLLSVCISVHNTEKYLRRCLDSVFQQSLENLEIVLVDNGSTDGSYQIMVEYKNSYPKHRVVIVQQKDLGLAQGRLTGVNNATGEYITFLDADDYVEKNAYEETMRVAVKHEPDVVEFKTLRKGRTLGAEYEGLQSAHSVLREYFVGGKIYSMLWLRVYKRELFSSVVFPNMYVNNEDMFAFPCLLSRANTVFFLNETLHHYCDDNESGYMKRLLSDNPKKVYESKNKILNSVRFVDDNTDCSNRFKEEFQIYKKRRIIDYLTYPIKGYNTQDLIDSIIENMGISKDSFAELIKNTKSNIPIFDCLERFLGFFITCRIYKALFGFRKRVNV